MRLVDDISLDEMRELAGKVLDGHADEQDVAALADEVIRHFGSMNDADAARSKKLERSKKEWQSRRGFSRRL